MQSFTATLLLAAIGSAAALPTDLSERATFTGGRCRVEISSSTTYGCWNNLNTVFYDGAGKKVAYQSAPVTHVSSVCDTINPYTIKAGVIPHDLSITPENNNITPLAKLTYAGFTFDGQSDVCTVHTSNNIVTGMTCGFAC